MRFCGRPVDRAAALASRKDAEAKSPKSACPMGLNMALCTVEVVFRHSTKMTKRVYNQDPPQNKIGNYLGPFFFKGLRLYD